MKQVRIMVYNSRPTSVHHLEEVVQIFVNQKEIFTIVVILEFLGCQPFFDFVVVDGTRRINSDFFLCL